MRIRIVNRIDISKALRDYTVDNVDITIEQFFKQNLKNYKTAKDIKGITIIVDGISIPHKLINKINLKNVRNLTFIIEPQGTGFLVASIIIALASAVYSFIMMRKMQTKGTDSGKNSSSIYDVNAQGNQIKLEEPIPEQFGLVKAFPDYASDKHFYYVNNNRYMDVLLCQGVGYYNHSLDTMYIGSTPLSAYVGTDIDVLIAEPGEDISEHPAHRCWFNSTEIDSAGKEVPAKNNAEARSRGDKQLSDITFNEDNTCLFSTGAQYYAGDYIRIYNATGYDLELETKNIIEEVINSVRVYVNEYPVTEEQMSFVIGRSARLLLTDKDGNNYEIPTSLQNYGSHNEKGKFIDFSRVSINYSNIDTVVILFNNFAFPEENINSTHLNDNGIYKIIAATDQIPCVYTLQAEDKKGVGYQQVQGWNKFVKARICSDCLIELLDSANAGTAKSNVAGYYRACPIGATAQYYEVDLDFPSGLYEMDDKGHYNDRTANILIEYRIQGSIDEPHQIFKSYTKKSPDEFAETVEIDVGDSNHAYEFRITNQTEFSDESNVQQTFMWNGLKCLIAEKTKYDDVTMICLTVKGSQSLSELSNNQISTIWERRLSPLKDIESIIQESEEVTGYNTFNVSNKKTLEYILNSKKYPKEWDAVPDDNDHAYVGNYVNFEKIFEYHYRFINIAGTKPIYNYDGGFYPLVDNNQHGLNYPSTEWRAQGQVVFKLSANNQAPSSRYRLYYGCYFVFGINNIDNISREQLSAGAFNWRGSQGYPFQGLTYALKFDGCNRDPVDIGGEQTFPPESNTRKIQLIRFNSSSIYSYDVVADSGKVKEELLLGGEASFIVEKTENYIRVTIGDQVTTVTIEEEPGIKFCTGNYFGWWIGGYNTDSWKLHVRDFSLKIPTNLTILKYKEASPITLNVDREANRALAPAIRYICDTSKFGKELYNSENLYRFDEHWRDKGFNFDFRFDKETTLLEAIQQVAQVGFAEPIIKGNEINIIHKTKNAQIRQLFTSGNMTGDPKITYTFISPDDNNQIDCKYTSSETWKSDELYISVDDDNNQIVERYPSSTNLEKAELLAVTDPNRAIELSLRRLREILFCRKQIEFQTELDALNCEYGDLIAVALPQNLSAYAGRITGIDKENNIIYLSNKVNLDDFGAGVMYVRRPDGTAQTLTVIANDEYSVIAAEDMDTEYKLENQETMPLYAFGEVNKWWITSIKPSSNNTKCTVVATNYDQRVFGPVLGGYGLGGYGLERYGE